VFPEDRIMTNRVGSESTTIRRHEKMTGETNVKCNDEVQSVEDGWIGMRKVSKLKMFYRSESRLKSGF
jgi:hypothetical protein